MNRKRHLLALLAVLAFAGSAEAQIFNTQADGNGMRSQTDLFGTESLGAINIIDGHTGSMGNESLGNETITPIGSGLFLLAGMAGAYAMVRRKKQGGK